jgi:hypothetical protein
MDAPEIPAGVSRSGPLSKPAASQLFYAAVGKRLLSGEALCAKLTRLARLAEGLRRPLERRAEALLRTHDGAALRAEEAAAAAAAVGQRFRDGADPHLATLTRAAGIVDEAQLQTGRLGAAAAWGKSLKHTPLTDFAVAAVAATLPGDSPADEPPLPPALLRRLREFYDCVVAPEYGALLECGDGEVSAVLARLMRALEGMGGRLLGLPNGSAAGQPPTRGSFRWAMSTLGEFWNGEVRARLGAEAEITGSYGLSLAALMMEISMTPARVDFCPSAGERRRFLLEVTIFVDAMNHIARRIESRKQIRTERAARGELAPAPKIQAGDLQMVVTAMETVADEQPALWKITCGLIAGLKQAAKELWRTAPRVPQGPRISIAPQHGDLSTHQGI